jgi:hypothetical protein
MPLGVERARREHGADLGHEPRIIERCVRPPLRGHRRHLPWVAVNPGFGRSLGVGDTIITTAGTNAGGTLVLGIGFIGTSFGIHPIGPGSGEVQTTVLPIETWITGVAGGIDSSITVDTVTGQPGGEPARVTGTFQFLAVPLPGSGVTDTLKVTNGKFAISFGNDSI